jgi:hypothetical protein
MNPSEKYLTRRHLEAYSEISFSKFLFKKGIAPYFPFKDVGIDMVAFKGNKIEFYQLKARNENLNQKRVYWFSLKKNLHKLSKFRNTYFILCALQPNQKEFHFFKIPIKMIIKYFKKKHARNARMFEIKRISESNYKLMPQYLKWNINKYRLN